MIKPQQLIEIGLITATLSVMLGESVRATSSQLKTSSSSPQPAPIILAQSSSNSEADRLLNEGLQLFRQGTAESLRQAIEKWQAARELYRAVGDRRTEAIILNNIGDIYSSLGEKQQALEYFNQALPIVREVGDRRGEAITLSNIGGVYSDLGEKQQALDYYHQALPILRAVGDRKTEAGILNNIGSVYSSLGEKQQALEYYHQSLPLSREVGNRRGEATTLSNIGGVYYYLGEKQQALDYLNQALPILRAVGDRRGEATTLSNIGGVYLSLGEKQQALDYLNQALPILRAVGDRRREAATLSNIGNVYSDQEKNQQALDYLNQALPLSRAVGDRETEARTLYNFAFLKRRQGDLTAALTDIESAINIIEELRTKIDAQELRQSYFATVQNYYELYINILMELHQQNPQKGYDALAFHASERSRARSLVELLTEAGANIRQGVDPKLLEQEQNLLQQLNAVEYQRYQLTQGQYTETQIDELKAKSQALSNQLNQLQTQIRLTSPRYAALKYPQPLNLPEVQQLLDEDTLLLQYSLGEERSFLWAVTKDSITSYILPSRTEIEAVATPYRQAVSVDDTTTVAQGLALSEILISPVVNQLSNQRLLIVGDGILQLIPFAALPVPSQPDTPLLVKHEIVTSSSTSTLAIQRQQLQNRPSAPKTVAVIADPVFESNDPRLNNQVVSENHSPTLDDLALARATRSLGLLEDIAPQLNRLKYSRDEAESIAELVPENERLKALDFQASRDLATHSDLSQYQTVHFATHGLVDPDSPELSGVVLSLFNPQGESDNGFLRLNDIFNLNLPAELVVLSACKTGLGREVKGEGLVGLTRGFMYAGARRVVVSLWNVNDLATSQLMTRFYQQMLNENQQSIVALRQAQLEMWNSGQWQSPYYWAAFTIQGDWR